MYVYDDGSNSYHKERLNHYLKIIKGKYTLFIGKHIGLFEARRYIFNKANGDIIVSIDADDAFTNNHVLFNINKSFQYDIDLIIYNATANSSTFASLMDYGKLTQFSNKKLLLNETRKEFTLHWYLNSVCTKAFSKKLVKDIYALDNVDITLGEDRLFTALLLDKISNINIITDAWYYYRQNDSSHLHSEITIDNFKSIIAVENIVKQYAKKWRIKEYDFSYWICDTFINLLLNYWSNNGSLRKWEKLFDNLHHISEFNIILNNFPNYMGNKIKKFILGLFIKNKKWFCALILICYTKFSHLKHRIKTLK